MVSEPTAGEPASETTDVTQESPEAQDMSVPAPGPQTKDPREFLESEPAYGDSDRPGQADDEDAGLGLDSMPATDPAGGPPRDPDLGVDEQAPQRD